MPEHTGPRSAIDRPIVGITMGDAAGIGPEIIAKALSHERVYQVCRPLVIGDARVMTQAVGFASRRLHVNPVREVQSASFVLGQVDTYDVPILEPTTFAMGKVDPRVGKAAVTFTEIAARLALAGEIHAICSAPVNKEAMHQAGYRYPGQSELLAHLTGSDHFAMILVSGPFRVFFVTNHASVRSACDMIKRDRVLTTVRLAQQGLQEMGIPQPRLCVCGLNPHAGEGGVLGREEIEEIIPAIHDAHKEGITVDGPIPGDVIFGLAREGKYDGIVAMLHDQGNIPVKLLGAGSAVTVLTGLPIIRTSVAHGTAFDIAGKGIARPDTLVEAIVVAAQIARARSQQVHSGAEGHDTHP